MSRGTSLVPVMLLIAAGASCGSAPRAVAESSPLPRHAPYLGLDAVGHEKLAAVCDGLRLARYDYNHPAYGLSLSADLITMGGQMQATLIPEVARYGRTLRDYARSEIQLLVLRQALDLCRVNRK